MKLASVRFVSPVSLGGMKSHLDAKDATLELDEAARFVRIVQAGRGEVLVPISNVVSVTPEPPPAPAKATPTPVTPAPTPVPEAKPKGAKK